MSKFIPGPVLSNVWAPDEETVFAASAAIEALAKWQYCDCGCPSQQKPLDRKSVDFLRIAAFLRVNFLSE